MNIKWAMLKALPGAVLTIAIASTLFAQTPATGGQTSPPTKDKLIGQKHGDQLPLDYKYVGGALLSDPYRDPKQYGVTEVSRGKGRAVWFERLSHHDETGHAHWEILDVLFLPQLTKGQMLFYSTCTLAGKPEVELVAITDAPPRGRFYGQVRNAWRANRKTEKIEEIPLTGIKCEIQGEG